MLVPKAIQIRNVPDRLHRVLKKRAADAGLSLSGYVMELVRQIAEKPTVEEMLKRSSAFIPFKE